MSAHQLKHFEEPSNEPLTRMGSANMPSSCAASRLDLFPITARIEALPTDEGRGMPGQGHLTIAGCDLSELAEEHGTPLYLYDEATLRDAVAAYTAALGRHYPGLAGLTYAGKAFLCLAMAQWASGQGLWLDCTGAGEIGIAAAAGVQRSAIVVHGVNKSEADIAAALAHAGSIVVDNLVELEKLSARLGTGQDLPRPELWLRIRPGLAVETHTYTQTGQEDSKFGMDRHQAITAAELCLERGLPLTGLHFHLGSHFHDPAPVGPALDRLLDLMAALHRALGWQPRVLSPGGGWGVAYHEEDLPQPSIDAYVQLVGERVASGCHQRGLALPRLQLEPGRSIVARAGVALYRIGAVKHTAHRRWLLLDGGLADNPRPALYAARYSALPVLGPDRPDAGPAWLGGPYCESSDVLIEGLSLPDMAPDELIAVPVSGAYQLSMASNYNGACRPAVLWLVDGQAHLIREREVADDLIRRDWPLPAQAGNWIGAHA